MKFLRQFHCRAAWPPPVLAVGFIFCYFVFLLGMWLVAHSFYNDFEAGILDMEKDAHLFSIVIGVAVVLHVLVRLVRFHPAWNPRYASWLALSPWKSAKPLPLGPIHPVWQDAAVLVFLSALGHWLAHVNPALPWGTAVLAYAMGLTLLLAATSTWFFFMAAAFLWPSILLTGGAWLPLCLIFAALIVVLWIGTRKSLQAFPWRQENRNYPGLSKSSGANTLLQTEIRIEGFSPAATVGWAFAQLSPKPKFRSVSRTTDFWRCLLIGWWVYCLLVKNDAEPMPGFILAYGIGGAFVRLGAYCSGYSPSFSFRSRIFFGRVIVPGFDQILIAPILAIIVAIIGGMVTAHAGKLALATHAFFLTVILFVLFATGPTMRDWALTGEHRLRPLFPRSNSRQGYRPV